MREGWLGEDYLVLFSAPESSEASRAYGIKEYLPGYQILGLRGWDDFIVQDATGVVHTVPCLPIDSEHLSQWTLPPSSAVLESDLRFTGKIKWYIKPLIFGGDPSDPANMDWVSHELHIELVVWWNPKYRELIGNARN